MARGWWWGGRVKEMGALVQRAGTCPPERKDGVRSFDGRRGFKCLARKTEEQRELTRLLGRGWLRERLNHRQVALLTHALRHPGETYRLATHQAVHKVVYQTARVDLLDLESLGLLEKTKQGNAFVFHAVDDLERRLEVVSQHGGVANIR